MYLLRNVVNTGGKITYMRRFFRNFFFYTKSICRRARCLLAFEIFLIFILAVPFATSSCRKATSRRTHGEPIHIKEGMFSKRSYFQTRNSIVLNLESSVISLGDTFSLFNDSSKKALIENEALEGELKLSAFQVSQQNSMGLNSYEVSIKIFPTDVSNMGKFVYGENELRLLVDDGKNGKASEYQITRRDFTKFAVGAGSFENNSARYGGLEVAPAGLVRSVLTNGKHTMVLGPVDMWVH